MIISRNNSKPPISHNVVLYALQKITLRNLKLNERSFKSHYYGYPCISVTQGYK